MLICHNCSKTYEANADEGLTVLQGGIPVAYICPDCTADVAMARVVIRRKDEGRFNYEQYEAVELTKKAFGK